MCVSVTAPRTLAMKSSSFASMKITNNTSEDKQATPPRTKETIVTCTQQRAGKAPGE
jgi:hypothetical protein